MCGDWQGMINLGKEEFFVLIKIIYSQKIIIFNRIFNNIEKYKEKIKTFHTYNSG